MNVSRLLLAATAAVATPWLFGDPQFMVSLSMTKSQINSPTPPSSGLFLENGAGTWRHLGGEQIKWVNCAIGGAQGQYLLGCGNGILRSTDSGATWRITTTWEVADVTGLEQDQATPSVYYAATGWGVWKSTDGGAHWTEASRGLHGGAHFVQTVAESRHDRAHLLIGTAEGLFASNDGGDQWAPVSDAPRAAVLSVRESAKNPSVWLMGTEGAGVFVSTDDGLHWSPTAEPLEKSMSYGVSVNPADAAVYAASSWQDGVYLSSDAGSHWTDISAGLPTRHVTALAFDPRRPQRLWAAIFEAGIYWTDDNGAHWTMAGLDGADILELRFSN